MKYVIVCKNTLDFFENYSSTGIASFTNSIKNARKYTDKTILKDDVREIREQGFDISVFEF